MHVQLCCLRPHCLFTLPSTLWFVEVSSDKNQLLLFRGCWLTFHGLKSTVWSRGETVRRPLLCHPFPYLSFMYFFYITVYFPPLFKVSSIHELPHSFCNGFHSPYMILIHLVPVNGQSPRCRFKPSPKQGFSGECQHNFIIVNRLGYNWTENVSVDDSN